jgi:23S rRNA (cytidine1920-2'-O)/16S rRNA (cytidine1409-2'-O)-methyltransferase
MTSKKRLDIILVEKGMVASRQKGQALIMAGSILVDAYLVDKPGTLVSPNAEITIKGDQLRFVSRGGLKLEAAIETYQLDIHGMTCLDIGASTGGFTDCLLQHGARHVYAVDVGYGQLAWKLRQDARVTAIERTNIRYMPADQIDEPVDLVTIDVSFISLKIVVPHALKFLSPGGRVVALIKPQFEVGKGMVGKGGVVKDTALQADVVASLVRFFKDRGLSTCAPPIPSPILGPKGNQEFIILLSPIGND